MCRSPTHLPSEVFQGETQCSFCLQYGQQAGPGSSSALSQEGPPAGAGGSGCSLSSWGEGMGRSPSPASQERHMVASPVPSNRRPHPTLDPDPSGVERVGSPTSVTLCSCSQHGHPRELACVPGCRRGQIVSQQRCLPVHGASPAELGTLKAHSAVK